MNVWDSQESIQFEDPPQKLLTCTIITFES